MKRARRLLFLFALLFISSCNTSELRLDYALEMAEDNRTGLEKVLAHFRDDPNRLEAARFIIGNMPGKYTLDSSSVAGNEPYYEALNSYLENHNDYGANGIYETIDGIEIVTGRPNVIAGYSSDLKTISPDFLIRRIDESVSRWESSPWKDETPFEDFLRFILPYRVYESWWDGAEDYYRSILADSVAVWSPLGMHEVAEKIRSYVSNGFRQDAYFFRLHPYMSPTRFENTVKAKIGVCYDFNASVITALRAFCIPATINAVPNWGNSNASHFWTEVIGTPVRALFDNTQLDFHTDNDELVNDTFWFKGGIIEDTTGIPALVELRKTRTVPKIYRKSYEIQGGALALQANEDIPVVFKDLTLEDVTSRMVVTTDIKVKVGRKDNPYGKHYAYLCCYDPDHFSWTPVAWAEIRNGKASFKSVGINVLYIAGLYDGVSVIPIGDPFVLEASGKVNYFKANLSNKESADILSKVPLRTSEVYYAMMMRGGRFQVANRHDLTDTATVVEIDHIPYYTEEVTFENTPSARYAIYRIDKSPTRFVAEIEFWGIGDDGKEIRLYGDEIGNPCYSAFPRHAAFDGDRVSFAYFDFDSDNDNYIGMDFGRPRQISRITFCPRNDDNAIIPGEEYELFYWRNGWQSLGRQTGGGDRRLHFNNIPQGALLRVHNHTRGKENRPFTIKDRGQIWW